MEQASQPWQAVLDFWFTTPGSAEWGTMRQCWFKKSAAFDQEIEQRFGDLVRSALSAGLDDWISPESSPQAKIGFILLLDQFTRNIFRNRAQMYSGDATVLAVAKQLVATDADKSLSLWQRMFCYLPYEHSEDLADQQTSLKLFAQLHADAGPDLAKWAQAHYDIVVRFGRFPHRNQILGRVSTDEEIEFLKQPGSGF